MRNIEDDFAARLASGETSLCACWRLTRADGQVFGATDHDRALSFDGVDYLPARSLEAAELVSGAGLAPGRAAAGGALDADFITEADLSAGLWDGARVDVWRVDWQATVNRVRIWSGRISEVKRGETGFTAELVSLKADLERPLGRVYSRACDAEVGDQRCGVDLADPAFGGAGDVSAALSATRFAATGLEAFASGWFSNGIVTWTSGANAGARSRVIAHGGGVIDLAAAPRFAIAPGDAFTITAGCDKSFAMCAARFSKRDNFRGFPHLPGADAVLQGPAADHPNNGGRR